MHVHVGTNKMDRLIHVHVCTNKMEGVCALYYDHVTLVYSGDHECLWGHAAASDWQTCSQQQLSDQNTTVWVWVFMIASIQHNNQLLGDYIVCVSKEK